VKLTKITAAVAALAVSGTASAYVPGDPVDIDMFVTGASAQDKSIAALFTDICVGTIDHMTAGKNWNAWSCQLDTARVPLSSGLTNPRILVQKRSAGGSGIGVAPLIDNVAVESMAVTAANCSADATIANQWNCSAPASGQNLRTSDMGVADVNPALFVAENTPFGQNAVDVAKMNANLNTASAAALVFGVPVTTSLRDALQVLQFGAADPCAQGPDGTFTWAPGNAIPTRETEACMPTLSRDQVASLYSAQIASWNNVYVNGKALTDPANYTGATPAVRLPTGPNAVVSVCRRVNGSGTEAQANSVFLRYPCTGNALSMAHYSVATDFTGPLMLENSGSGDVNVCLDDLEGATNNGVNLIPSPDGVTPPVSQGNNPTADGAAFGDPSYRRWGIGLQSTEKNQDFKYGYRFVKIDGASPTIDNAANGTYPDWVEQSYQWRKDLTGDKLDIVNHIVTNAASATFLGGTINPNMVYTWGQGGFLAVNGTPAANGVVNHAAPVMPLTHAPGVSSLDNCIVPVVKAGSVMPWK